MTDKLKMENMTVLNDVDIVDGLGGGISDIDVLQSIFGPPQVDILNRQLEWLLNEVQDVPGDIVELGVHTGNNAGQFMWFAPGRRYIGFDTFKGYTESDIENDPNKEGLLQNQGRWKYDKNKTIERLEDLNKKLNQVGRLLLANPDITLIYDFKIIDGDLKKTLPKAIDEGQIGVVSLLYVDCNAYMPAIKGMESIYPILNSGGMICIDEHQNGGESKALEEIATKHGLEIFETGFEFMTGVHSNPSKYIIKT